MTLAVVMGSQPVSASKKRSKNTPGTPQTPGTGSESGETSSKKGGDDERDEPPRRPAEPSPKGVAAGSAAGSGLPEWKEGAGWTVKTVYRKLPVGHAGKDTRPDEISIPGWTPPTYWAFNVKKVKAGGGATQYLLQAENKEGGAAGKASLYFARYPMGPATDVLALNRGKFYALMAGQIKPSSKAYVEPGAPPHPVLADDSVIPYDFPALPFQAKAPPGVKETELARTFSITEVLDEQKYARDVTQIEHQNTSLEAFAGKELAEYVKSKGWSTADLSMVEIRRKFEGTTIKQVWSPRLPWYLYSESPTSRSWLWDLEASRPRHGVEPSLAPAPAPSPE